MIILRHLLIAIASLLFLDNRANAQSDNSCQCIGIPKTEECWLYCLKYATEKQLIEKLKIDSSATKAIVKLPNRKSYKTLGDLKAALPKVASDRLSVMIENSSVRNVINQQENRNNGDVINGDVVINNNYPKESGRSTPTTENIGTLEANYSVSLNLRGTPQYKVIGSDAILKYFKLNGSHHKGVFIVAADKGIYFTNSDLIKKDQSYAFYLLGMTNDVGWSHEIHPCKPFCMIPGRPKLYIYSCGDSISYKIANGEVKSADEITF